jgi:transposase
VTIHRPGAFERAQLLLDDFRDTQQRLGETKPAWSSAVLDELQLSELVCSIVGLSTLGGASILAETGDLTRFATARATVKHFGLATGEDQRHLHRAHQADRARQTRTAHGCLAGGLGAQRANPVYAAKFTQLDQPDREQAQPWASPRSDCCRVAAPTVRGRVHKPEMGCGDRGWRAKAR